MLGGLSHISLKPFFDYRKRAKAPNFSFLVHSYLVACNCLDAGISTLICHSQSERVIKMFICWKLLYASCHEDLVSCMIAESLV